MRWWWLASAAAALAAVGSIVGFLAPGRICRAETTVLADAAAAQDAVDLALLAPLEAVLEQVSGEDLLFLAADFGFHGNRQTSPRPARLSTPRDANSPPRRQL